MATQKTKAEYAQECKDKGFNLTGEETVAELKGLLESDLHYHDGKVQDPERVLTGDPEKDATNEYERLCAVYDKLRERTPKQWELHGEELLSKLDAVASELNIKNTYE